MNDSNTFNDAKPRWDSPKGRASMPRMIDPERWLRDTNMVHKKGHSKNNSNSSSPSTPPHSTPIKKLNSPAVGDDLKKYSPGSRLYPKLPDPERESLDESNKSISGKSNNQSCSDTQSSNSITSDESSIEQRSSNTSYASKSRNDHFINEWKANQGSKNSSNFRSVLWAIIIALIGVVIYCLLQTQLFYSYKTEENIDKFDLVSKISNLSRLFPSQDKDIWAYFGTGIDDVRNKHVRPAIFILLATHNETTNCLAVRVAELARSALRGSGDVILTPDKLGNNGSKVFDLIEDRMKRTKAVVVSDLLSIQPEAIKAFHDICDQYHNLVAEAVYLFTMSLGPREESNLMKFAENQLRNKFSKTIKEDTLEALITRFTNGAVLAIKEEKEIPCSK